MKYDEEEMEILEVYEAGEMKLSTPTMEEMETIRSAAERTINNKGKGGTRSSTPF